MAITVNKLSPVYDLDLQGGVDNNGRIKELWNEDAVSNSLKLWLASAQGEILRDPTRGGYLFPFLVKPMNITNQQDLQDTIIDGLREDFEPYLKIKSISVEPDYSNRRWKIEITAWIPSVKSYVVVSEKIKNFV